MRPFLRPPSSFRPASALLLFALFLVFPAGVAGQGLKIAVGDAGIGLGPVPRIDGVRLNFRDDDRLERVRGVNATIWTPREDIHGDVTGLALGLPLTGARDVEGIALGAGIAAFREFRGIGVAILGMGAGGDVTGIAVSGLGTGAGGSLRGLALGGIGVGAGGSIDGIAIGGIGVGAGRHFTGLGVAGVGIGAGSSLEGVFVTAGGIGSGAEIRGIALAGLGVGAPRIEGLAAALGVGGVDVRGVILAPAYFRLVEEGRLTGVTVSAYNDIRGAQHGLAIGLVNITEELHGVQIGLVNIARNKDRFPVLPVVNFHP